MEDKDLDDCPEVTQCLAKKDWQAVYHLKCLRQIAAPLAWNTKAWDPCRAKALKLLADHFSAVAHGRKEDYGGVFLKLLLGEAVAKCEEQHLASCGAVSWETAALQPGGVHDRLKVIFREWHNGLDYDVFVKQRALALILGNDTEVVEKQVDVLTVGPYGYDNEIVFGPALHLPTRAAKVACLIVRDWTFPSSSVQQVIFPWSLQVDVDLAALFVRDVIRFMKPRWVFPSDSAGVLVLARVGVAVHRDGLAQDDVVRMALSQSGPWPPKYPPPALSKLMEGHENFAPRETIISRDDGLSEISPDFAKALEAVSSLGGTVFLKKEYSEAGHGVMKATRENVVDRMLEMFPRSGSGMSLMDLDLTVRVFAQKEVITRSKPLGLRFFAMNGVLIAGHLSEVEVGTSSFGVRYITKRNLDVERATSRLVQKLNYTGFGAAWWWFSDRPYLIDFNPRLERHACLSAVLSGADLLSEPCVVFQQIVMGFYPKPNRLPLMVRAGVQYMEPIRSLTAATKTFLQMLTEHEVPWNIHQQDKKLKAFIEDLLAQHKDLIESARVIRPPGMAKYIKLEKEARQLGQGLGVHVPFPKNMACAADDFVCKALVMEEHIRNLREAWGKKLWNKWFTLEHS